LSAERARKAPAGAIEAGQERRQYVHLRGPMKEMGMQQAHISALETKHAEIEARIAEESQRPQPDTGLLARLKKEKLKVKEAITGLA
jgi:hypothetical protein